MSKNKLNEQCFCDGSRVLSAKVSRLSKDRDAWKLAAETWKKAFNDLTKSIEKRMRK